VDSGDHRRLRTAVRAPVQAELNATSSEQRSA
jgi:hypothetical protein